MTEPPTLRVDVIPVPGSIRAGGPGHQSYEIHPGGGSIKEPLSIKGVDDPYVAIEIRPNIECETDEGRYRSYSELEKICDLIEDQGGYAVKSSYNSVELSVGRDIVVGRDVIEILQMMNRRLGERAGDQSAAYKQGFEAGRRATAQAVEEAIEKAEAQYE
jgi:hypothetical protein